MPIPIPVSTIRKIPNGDKGTDKTVAYMRDMIRKGSIDPEVRNLAIALTYNTQNNFEKIGNLFNFVQSRMAYVKDNFYVETLQTPHFMTRQFHEAGASFGDCDDHTIFLGSLLIAIGFPVKIVTVRVGQGYGPFNHVYLKTFNNGVWIPLDGTNKNKPMGCEVKYVRKKEFTV